jgi:uncharacterized membrane protein YphA (DoxX/SURF4 family)
VTEPATSTGPSRARTVAYWITTGLLSLELTVGGFWGVLRIPYVRRTLEHLGYPTYFAVIMGVWELLGAVAILAPGLPRLKEWAYAGAFFVFTGAAASHLAAGDNAGATVAPIILTAITVASWSLRPPTRRALTGNEVNSRLPIPHVIGDHDL